MILVHNIQAKKLSFWILLFYFRDQLRRWIANIVILVLNILGPEEHLSSKKQIDELTKISAQKKKSIIMYHYYEIIPLLTVSPSPAVRRPKLLNSLL